MKFHETVQYRETTTALLVIEQHDGQQEALDRVDEQRDFLGTSSHIALHCQSGVCDSTALSCPSSAVVKVLLQCNLLKSEDNVVQGVLTSHLVECVSYHLSSQKRGAQPHIEALLSCLQYTPLLQTVLFLRSAFACIACIAQYV